MAHLGLVLEIEKAGINLVFAQRGQRHRGDELLPAFGHHAGYIATALADQPHEFARFVGSDTAAHDQQDFWLSLAHRQVSTCEQTFRTSQPLMCSSTPLQHHYNGIRRTEPSCPARFRQVLSAFMRMLG